METDFEVAACHGDRAGKAHVVVKRLGGSAEIAVQNMPFETRKDEQLAQEQARILADAARMARETADFLEAEASLVRGWPTRTAAPGPSPGSEGEAPSAFEPPAEPQGRVTGRRP